MSLYYRQIIDKQKIEGVKMNEKYRKTFRISIENYLNEVENIPLITEEEEKELGERIANGDKEAIDTLIQSNLRFVISIATAY